MRALITKFIKWLESLLDEGKSDMTEVLAAAETEIGKIAADLNAEGAKVVGALEGDAALVEAKVTTLVAPLASKGDAVVTTDVDKFAATLKVLMAKSDQSAPAFDKIVAFAKALLPGADIDALAAKLKELIPVSGQALTAWDEMVALAKALNAAV